MESEAYVRVGGGRTLLFPVLIMGYVVAPLLVYNVIGFAPSDAFAGNPLLSLPCLFLSASWALLSISRHFLAKFSKKKKSH